MAKEVSAQLARLLTSSIQTKERLDVLFHLRKHMGKTWTARAVASALSMTPSTAEHALAMLCGRGFLTVTIGSDLLYAYAPVSPEIDRALGEIAELLAEDRDSVLTVLRRTDDEDPVRAFANAFLLRKGDKDDG